MAMSWLLQTFVGVKIRCSCSVKVGVVGDSEAWKAYEDQGHSQGAWLKLNYESLEL